jgi:hypothetical protein
MRVFNNPSEEPPFAVPPEGWFDGTKYRGQTSQDVYGLESYNIDLKNDLHHPTPPLRKAIGSSPGLNPMSLDA